MNSALVVLLALVWALVLLPGAIRSRRSSPSSSVGTFERAMNVLARREQDVDPGGRVVYVPKDAARLVGERRDHRREQLARRRRVFTNLLAGVGVSLLLSLLLGGVWWALFVLTTGSLGGYVALLLRWKSQREQADEVVRSLPEFPEHEEVVVADEQVAVGGDSLYGLPVAHGPDDPWEPHSAVRIRVWEE